MHENDILATKEHDSVTGNYQLDQGKINLYVVRVVKASLRHQLGHRQDAAILCDGRCVHCSGMTCQNEFK